MLSAVRDVFELTLARWDKKEQWSPWNCVLMTKDEAKAHIKLDDIQEVGSFLEWHTMSSRKLVVAFYLLKVNS